MLLKAGFSGLGLVLSSGGGLGTALSAAAIGLRALSGAAIAFGAGYWAGNVINDHLSDNTKMGIGRGVATVLAMFGNKEAQDALNSESRYVRSQQQSRAMINNTIVMPNGQVLARVVTHEQAKEAQRPQAGSSHVDGRMTPAHVGATGSW